MHSHPEASSREENPAPATADELAKDLKALSDGFIEELQRLWVREEARAEWDMEILTWDETEGLEDVLKGLGIGDSGSGLGKMEVITRDEMGGLKEGLEIEDSTTGLGKQSETSVKREENPDCITLKGTPDEKEKDMKTDNKREASPSHPSSSATHSTTKHEQTGIETRKNSSNDLDVSPPNPEHPTTDSKGNINLPIKRGTSLGRPSPEVFETTSDFAEVYGDPRQYFFGDEVSGPIVAYDLMDLLGPGRERTHEPPAHPAPAPFRVPARSQAGRSEEKRGELPASVSGFAKSLWKSALGLRGGGRERKSPAVGVERRERQMQLKKRFEARTLHK